MPSTLTDRLIGQRFGALVVVGAAPSIPQTNGKRKSAVHAKCDCGTEKVFVTANLKSGNSKSCGCQKFKGFEAFNEDRAAPQPWTIEGDVASLVIDGVTVLVDTVDLPLVDGFRWGLRDGYVVARGGRLTMHRLILGLADGDPHEGDHRDHNTTDNRRSMLRIATSAQNKWNNRGQPDTSSRFKGVSFDRERNKFRAQIKAAGRRKMIGRFATEIEAAVAYNREARKHFGEFAFLNDVGEAA